MTSPRQTRALLDRHGISPRKGLGQHFLVDANIIDRIVRTAAIQPGDLVVEVGAGTGALTSALLRAGAEVIAFEVDERLAPILAETAPGADIRLADITGVDLAAELERPAVMVANLPYNIGTRLILDTLREVPAITALTVMVQKEVAERLVASPGSRDYGLPSVVTRLWGEPKIVFTVPPQVFLPPPEVESAVVTIQRRTPPPAAAEAVALAAIAFGQRRKTLRRSLREHMHDIEHVLERCGIAPTARPEQLSPEQWLDMVKAAA